VLVVDDAVVVRRLVSEALCGQAGIEIVGTAPNGRVALQKVEQLTPDLVILDVEMPEMDGLTTLVEIRKRWTKLPVIIFSGAAHGSAVLAVQALARGASELVLKPAANSDADMAKQRVRDELVPRILALCPRAPAPYALVGADASSVSRAVRPRAVGAALPRIELVAIGTSTGGPNALATLFSALPANFPVPIVITQHMPPVFTRMLAQRLSHLSPLTVREAYDGARLTAGSAWIAPGDFHLGLRRVAPHVEIELNQEPAENSCRPAVDPMLRAAHQCYGGNVLTVMLTGMGRDGARGAQLLKEAGGLVLVQDEASSVVWGMPGAVVGLGLADSIVPLEHLAHAVLSRVVQSRSASPVVPSDRQDARQWSMAQRGQVA
jgi:two-component system chemotaxis response regulator CheB